MANAYNYKDIVDGKTNPPIKNAEYCKINSLEETPLRQSNIVIRPVSAKFEPYIPEETSHMVTLVYPKNLSLSYNSSKIGIGSINGNSATSTINVPSQENGSPYFVKINYSPTCRVRAMERDYTNGIISLGQVGENISVQIEYRYKYEFANPDGHVNMISSGAIAISADASQGNNSFTKSESSVKVFFDVQSDYQIKNFKCTNCKIVPTGTENEYIITYGNVSVLQAKVEIQTELKKADKTYHNVIIKGLENATATYNSVTLSETAGTAIIPNVESGTTISVLISADSDYTLSATTIGSEKEPHSIPDVTLSIPVADTDVNVLVETKLRDIYFVFAGSPYIQDIVLADNMTSGTSEQTLKYTLSNLYNVNVSLQFRYDKTKYALSNVNCSEGATITSTTTTGNYKLKVTSETTPKFYLNYTLTPIGKKSVTFKNAANVTVKKGTTKINTSSGGYSESFSDGSSATYTISANDGYTLDSVKVTPTSSKYSYSNNTLKITNITDDVIVTCTTTKIPELNPIKLYFNVSGGTIDYLLIGESEIKVETSGDKKNNPIVITNGSKSIFYQSRQLIKFGTIQSGKVISNVTSSNSRSITGDLKKGYYVQVTDVYHYPTITINITLSDESETPVTPTKKYEVVFHNSQNAVITYDGRIRSVNGCDGDDYLTSLGVPSGSTATVKIEVTDTDKYEFAFIPSVSTTGYTSNWNESEQILTIPNITSDVDVYLSIREKTISSDDWEGSVKFYPSYSSYSSSLYWKTNTSGYYEYSRALSNILYTTAWWICFDYKYANDYLIETSYSNISKIYMYRSVEPILASSLKQASAIRIELNADDYKVENGFRIPAKNIGTTSDCKDYKYIYFAFVNKEYSSEIPVIFDVKYQLGEIGTSSSFSTNEIFDSNSISDFQFVKECDPTSQNIVYSSLTFKVYDETNSFKLSEYNQNLSGATSKDRLTEGFPYEIYTMSANATNKKSLGTADYYITQIGRMYLNKISYGGDYSVFEFIGVIEKYDNIYLNSSEKRYSNYYTPDNTREYLKIIFGSDIDVSEIPESFSTITPFEEESKTEILRTISEYLGLIFFEGADGKIHFSTRTTPNNPTPYKGRTLPYKLDLNDCQNFPSYEQLYTSYDSANTQINRKLLGSRFKVVDKTFSKTYVKLVDPPEGKSWEEDEDWLLVAKKSNTDSYYYTPDGIEYVLSSEDTQDESVNFLSILEQYGKIKYIKEEIEFENPCENMEFTCNDLIMSNIHVEKYSFQRFCEFLYGSPYRGSLFVKSVNNPTGGDLLTNCVKAYLSQKRFELYLKFPIEENPKEAGKYIVHYVAADIFSEDNFRNGFSTEDFTKYEEKNPPQSIDYATIVLDIELSLWLSFSNSTAQTISTATRNYLNRLADTNNNTLDFINPLATTLSEASLSSSLAIMANNNATVEAVANDWRGNGLIELGDNILLEHSSGRDGNRKYSEYYCGIVKKNEYSFDGALSMNTTLALGNSPYYDSDNTNDEVMIKLSDSPAFVNGKVNFVKKK